jgi:hypothetical protein
VLLNEISIIEIQVITSNPLRDATITPDSYLPTIELVAVGRTVKKGSTV